ncbi:MAG: flagellar hook-length control protein FliK [Dethiobacter sp.]|nr:flagellar hook-length control protein FliK [Dethiobacter sp.]
MQTYVPESGAVKKLPDKGSLPLEGMFAALLSSSRRQGKAAVGEETGQAPVVMPSLVPGAFALVVPPSLDGAATGKLEEPPVVVNALNQPETLPLTLSVVQGEQSYGSLSPPAPAKHYQALQLPLQSQGETLGDGAAVKAEAPLYAEAEIAAVLASETLPLTLPAVQGEQSYGSLSPPAPAKHYQALQLPLQSQGETLGDSAAVKAEAPLYAEAEIAPALAPETLPVSRPKQESSEARLAESSPQAVEKLAWPVRELPQTSVAQMEKLPLARHSVVEQVLEKMIFSRNESGEARVFIRLKPEALGEVEIRLQVEDGRLTGRIVAENVLVREILEASLGQLKQRLEAQQIQLLELTVSVGQEKGFQRGRDWSDGTGAPPGRQDKLVPDHREELSRPQGTVLPGMLNALA